MVKFQNNKFNILILGVTIILILSLVFICFKERNTRIYSEQIYISALENNLIHINDSRIYLEQIISDYENINDYELKLNSIAKDIRSIGEIMPIIMYNDKAKNFVGSNTDGHFNSFVVLFTKYSQIVNDWSININEEKAYGYPKLEDLKGLQNDLIKFYDLFLIRQDGNVYYVSDVKLKKFNYSYVSNEVIKIISNSYFDDIKTLY